MLFRSSSVIAGIQVQEAVKVIHGLPTLAGKGYIFEGMNHSSYVVEYTSNDDCMSHYTLPTIAHLPETSDELTLDDLRIKAQADLGTSEVTIEFSRDVLQKFVCPACQQEEDVYQPLGTVRFEDSKCKNDGRLRTAITLHCYAGEEDLGSRKLNQLGLPAFDVFVARAGEQELGYIPYRDASAVLGQVAGEREVVPQS